MSADLNEIRDALAKATPGPWERVPLDRVSTRPSDCYDVRTLDGEWLCESIDYADAYLISNAPAWLAELCDRVERAEAAIERVRAMAGDGDDFDVWVPPSVILRALDGAQ